MAQFTESASAIPDGDDTHRSGATVGTESLLCAPWKRMGKTVWIGLLLGAMVLFVLHPLLIESRYPSSHEGYRYAVMTKLFGDAFRNGVLYPRWLPDLAGGFGYPTFVFYQPLFFYVAMLFGFIPGLPCSFAPLLGVTVFLVSGAVGAYRLGRLFGDPRFGLFAAALFLLTPYLYVNFYVRGDLSEMAALLLTPWPLYFLLLLKQRVEERRAATWPAAGLAVGLVLVLWAHPATALFFWPACGVLALFTISACPRAARGRLLAFLLMSGVLAVALGAVYWWPAMRMKSLVTYEAATTGLFTPTLHLVYPMQLFSTSWGFGISSINDAHDGMSYQLGAMHFLLAALGVWFGRRNRILWGAALCYLLLAVLMLTPTRAIWQHAAILQYVQFPWRILSAIAALQLLCCLGWASLRVPPSWSRDALLTLLLVATALVHSNQFNVSFQQPGWGFRELDAQVTADKAILHYGFHTYAGVNEFTPRSCLTPAGVRGDMPLAITDAKADFRELAGHSEYHLHYALHCDAPLRVTLNQFHFPGWKVILDGKVLAPGLVEAARLPDGRMAVAIPTAGEHTLEAYYDGPPGSKRRTFLAALATLFFGTLGWTFDRRVRQHQQATAKADLGASAAAESPLRMSIEADAAKAA